MSQLLPEIFLVSYFSRFGSVLTIRHATEVGNGNLMVALLSIRTGIPTNPIMLVKRHVFKCMEAITCLLGLGMTNFARILDNISVKK